MKIAAFLIIVGIIVVLAWPILKPVKKSSDTKPGVNDNPKPDDTPEK
jgi:hypothetical protein